MTEIKAYTLCEGCNKEIEVPLQETPSGLYTVFTPCPYCKTGNPIWLKIVAKKETEPSK
jgi:hypothetical protein